VLGGYVATHLDVISELVLLLPIIIYAVLGIKHASIISERKAIPIWRAFSGDNNPSSPSRWISRVR
jgi:hypothetical protein